MRRSPAAFALFRRSTQSGDLWLAQWNAKWKAFNLIGGRREPGESARDCAAREVEEELLLTRHKDFTIATKLLAHLEFEAFSISAQESRHYEMDLFRANFERPDLCAQIAFDPANRWLNPVEISAGKTTDGQTISEVTQQFFQILQVDNDAPRS